MSKAAETAQILDFQHYREQRKLQEPSGQEGVSPPAFIWYPVWVLVPAQTPVPHS